jgi:hypothetical protein
MQMLSRPLLVITIAEALTDQSELKQEASGGTNSHASSESESQSDSQTLQSPSDIRCYVMYKSYLLCCIIIV